MAKPPTPLATTRGTRKGAVAPQPTIFLQLTRQKPDITTNSEPL
ncbi:MAG: hypothetical protein V7K61_25570 [Nostoc sp.]